MTVLTLTFALLQTVGQSGLYQSQALAQAQAQPQVQVVPLQSYQVFLGQTTREELRIIDRLRSLRVAVEKLPSTWKTTGVKSMPEGTMLTKAMLLDEIEGLELQAAERWQILLENTATVDQPASNSQVSSTRKHLEELPRVHLELNARLDEFNSKMKDGILRNLASSLVN